MTEMFLPSDRKMAFMGRYPREKTLPHGVWLVFEFM